MTLSKKLTEYFLAGDETNSLQLAQEYLKEHSREDLFLNVLTPAMYRIGDLWEKNTISVADEHLATAVCDFVVSAVDFRRDSKEKAARKVMVLGPEGEDHYIGLKMVASLFKENGWQVQYMGPNLPLEAAIASAERWKPDAVALSGALVYRLPALKRYAEEFRKLEFKPQVILGGRAVSLMESSLREIEGAVIVKDINALKKWIETGKEAKDEFDIFIG